MSRRISSWIGASGLALMLTGPGDVRPGYAQDATPSAENATTAEQPNVGKAVRKVRRRKGKGKGKKAQRKRKHPPELSGPAATPAIATLCARGGSCMFKISGADGRSGGQFVRIPLVDARLARNVTR